MICLVHFSMITFVYSVSEEDGRFSINPFNPEGRRCLNRQFGGFGAYLARAGNALRGHGRNPVKSKGFFVKNGQKWPFLTLWGGQKGVKNGQKSEGGYLPEKQVACKGRP